MSSTQGFRDEPFLRKVSRAHGHVIKDNRIPRNDPLKRDARGGGSGRRPVSVRPRRAAGGPAGGQSGDRIKARALTCSIWAGAWAKAICSGLAGCGLPIPPGPGGPQQSIPSGPVPRADRKYILGEVRMIDHFDQVVTSSEEGKIRYVSAPITKGKRFIFRPIGQTGVLSHWNCLPGGSPFE